MDEKSSIKYCRMVHFTNFIKFNIENAIVIIPTHLLRLFPHIELATCYGFRYISKLKGCALNWHEIAGMCALCNVITGPTEIALNHQKPNGSS